MKPDEKTSIGWAFLAALYFIWLLCLACGFYAVLHWVTDGK